MMKSLIIFLTMAVVVTLAQQRDYTTPVPILKQLNRHNDDGSYSYGYEGADGSFKIETKYANGEVYGKYGYVDDAGKVREVEYGASRRGFEPQGNDINVPPPTLNNNNYNYPQSLGPNEEDDGQYREDPSVYYKDEKFNTRPAIKSAPLHIPSGFNQHRNQAPQQQQPQYFNNAAPAPVYQQQQQQSPPSPIHRFQPYYQPQQQNGGYQNNGLRQPATNVDLNTGSYSLSYTGKK